MFSEAKRKQGRAESTIQKYQHIWRLLEKRVAEDKKVDDLTTDQLRDFVYDPSIKPATQQSRYRHVRAVLRWADEGSLLSPIERPRTGKKIPKAVREEELNQICQSLLDDYRAKRLDGRCRPRELVWLVPTFRFAYYSGLRGSELGRLRCSHVDLDRSRLAVFRQKSGHESTIPLVAAAKTLLRSLAPDQRGDAYVFCSPSGDRFNRSAKRFREHVSRKFAEYRDKAEVRSTLTMHGLRHDFATRLAENGASDVAIKKAIRHSSVSTSIKYIHMANGRLREELNDAFL